MRWGAQCRGGLDALDGTRAYKERVLRLAEGTGDTALPARPRVALSVPHTGGLVLVGWRTFLHHPSLLRVERGDDSFGEGCGGWEDLAPQDIPRIAELDGDAWGDFNRSGDLAPVADQVEHVGVGVISDLGFCHHL